MPKRKANLYMKTNPVAGDLVKDLKRQQILEQIAWIRQLLTYAHVDPFSAYNSVTALEDLTIAIFESEKINIKTDEEGNLLNEKKSKYRNPVLRELEEVNEKYRNVVARVRRTGQADFRFAEFLHEKFRTLLRILMSKGVITIDREVVEDV